MRGPSLEVDRLQGMLGRKISWLAAMLQNLESGDADVASLEPQKKNPS